MMENIQIVIKYLLFKIIVVIYILIILVNSVDFYLKNEGEYLFVLIINLWFVY